MAELPTASEIETRAKALGLAMSEVCRSAGIAMSTFYRWRAGATSPSLDVCQRLLDATAAISSPQSVLVAELFNGHLPRSASVRKE